MNEKFWRNKIIYEGKSVLSDDQYYKEIERYICDVIITFIDVYPHCNLGIPVRVLRDVADALSGQTQNQAKSK